MKQSVSIMAVGKKKTQAAAVGQRVLEGLDKGRQRANREKKERGAKHLTAILILVQKDRQLGRPSRGLAGRVARGLGGVLTERRIRQILSETLSSSSGSQVENGLNTTGGLAHAKR